MLQKSVAAESPWWMRACKASTISKNLCIFRIIFKLESNELFISDKILPVILIWSFVKSDPVQFESEFFLDNITTLIWKLTKPIISQLKFLFATFSIAILTERIGYRTAEILELLLCRAINCRDLPFSACSRQKNVEIDFFFWDWKENVSFCVNHVSFRTQWNEVFHKGSLEVFLKLWVRKTKKWALSVIKMNFSTEYAYLVVFELDATKATKRLQLPKFWSYIKIRYFIKEIKIP